MGRKQKYINIFGSFTEHFNYVLTYLHEQTCRGLRLTCCCAVASCALLVRVRVRVTLTLTLANLPRFTTDLLLCCGIVCTAGR